MKLELGRINENKIGVFLLNYKLLTAFQKNLYF